MQSLYDSFRVNDGIRASFLAGGAICTMLAWLLFTPVLYGHPLMGAASNIGTSATTESGSFTPVPAVPANPSGLTATAVSNARINLAWTDNSSNENGFKIEIKAGAAGTYIAIATVGANVTSYSSTGLEASTQYFYRVRAYNADGNSAYSNEANATTLPDPPAAPSGLQGTVVSTTQIKLTWTDNSNNETGFKIERKLNSAVTYTQIATVGANVTSYLSAGLTANTAYSYRIYAYNASGNSAYSNVASAKTLPKPPAAPSGLVATAMSNSRIDLSWKDNAGSELGFIIERKTDASSVYAVIDTVSANVMTYSSTGLTGSSQYFYQVRAYNAGGNSVYSNEANAMTLPEPPAAPGKLTANAVSSDQIDLAWTDNVSTEDGFKIEIKIGASGAYTEIAVVGANVTTYSSTGLDASTQYFYQVRAYNTGGHSAYSNAASATTLPDPPPAPSGLMAATVSDTQIKLTWTDNASNEDGFKIERKLSSAVTYTQIATVGANVKSYSNAGLSPNTAYSYRVRAFNTSGNSSYSNVASDTTKPFVLLKPSNLIATVVSSKHINLAWKDNSANESGFKLERKTFGGTYAQVAIVGANLTNFADTSLNANIQYFYRVRAYKAGGNSAYSNEASAKTLPNSPKAPSSLTAAAASNRRINLAWADSSNNENGFKIERKTGAAGTYAEIASAGMNVTNFADTSLAANTQYFYRVRAYNAGGNSAYSNEANAKTMQNSPKAPSSLTAAAVSSEQINLAWTDNSANESGFKIERKTLGGTYVQVAIVGANLTSYSNTGLSPGTEYFYRVRAYNAGGNSAYSNEANAITPNNGANLALNKPVTASSTDSSSTPSRAVDDNVETYWRSGFITATNSIAWLRVELSPSSGMIIGRAVVSWDQNYFANEYEFQISTDGTSWTTVYTNSAGTVGAQDFTFASTMARFVRLYLKKNQKSNYRVAELEVYAGSGAAKSATSDAPQGGAIIPEVITLAQNYPNPFWSEATSRRAGNPSTQIRYELPQPGHVSLVIYNSLGQEMRRLVEQQQPAGYHQATWNGRDQNGKPLPSGIYHYRLQVKDATGHDAYVATKKMLMAK